MLRPNAHRARIAQILLMIVLGLSVVMIASNIFTYLLVDEILTDGNYDEGRIALNDRFTQISAVLWMIGYIISGVTFILWFRRAYYNLNQIVKTDYTDGWAAGAWFVPIMNLYRPFQMMKELFEKGIKALPNELAASFHNNSGRLGLWWTLWIIGNILSRVGSSDVFLKDLEGIQTSSVMGMVSGSMEIINAIILVKIISDYNRIELQLDTIAKGNDPNFVNERLANDETLLDTV
jgi:hypothetical protein